MAKFKEILLHIGIDKTGSTAIQNSLFENREVLYEQQRCLIPNSIPKNLSTLVVAKFEKVGEPNIIRPIKKALPIQISNRIDQILSGFQKEIAKSSAERLILSGEMISMMTIPGIRNFKAFLADYASLFRIILVVRNPIDWTSSKIQQMVKSGMTLKSQYDNLPRQHIKTRVDRWSKVFDNAELDIIKFESDTKAGDMVQRFCNKIKIDHSFYVPIINSKINRSLSQLAIEKMSEFNQKNPIGSNVPLNILRQKRMIFQDLKGPKYKIPDSLITEVKSLATADLDWLAKHHAIRYYS